MAGLHVGTVLLFSLWTLWLLVALWLVAALWLQEKQRVLLLGISISLGLILVVATNITWRSYLVAWLAVHIVFAVGASIEDRRYAPAAMVSLAGFLWLCLQGGTGYVGPVVAGLLGIAFAGIGYGICWITVVGPLRQKLALVDKEAEKTKTRYRQLTGQGQFSELPEPAGDVRGDPLEVGPMSGGECVDELSGMTKQHRLSDRQKRQEQDAYGSPPELLRETQAPAERPRSSAGHGNEEISDGVSVGTPLDAPAKLYAERLRVFIVDVESSSPSERRFRIEIERDAAELPENELDDLGDASTITYRAEHEEGFKGRLAAAGADYFAGKVGDPVFTAVTKRWVTQDSFPETAVAEACDRISAGLNTLVGKPLEGAGTEIGLPGFEAVTAAGIATDGIVEPVARPLGQVAMVCEIAGVAVGAVTGFHPLALASGKMLLRSEFHHVVARGTIKAVRELLSGKSDQQPPREQPKPIPVLPEVAKAPVPKAPVSTPLWEKVVETGTEPHPPQPSEIEPGGPSYGPGIRGPSLG